MNRHETSKWIKKVMKSCYTHTQLNSTTKLIKRFEAMYPEKWLQASDLYDFKSSLRHRMQFK